MSLPILENGINLSHTQAPTRRENIMSDMTVAKTILEQLGGNKFRMMTGAKNFGGTENSLSMRIGRNKTSSNYLKITLNSMDTYDLHFSRVTKMGSERSVTEYNGVFNDMLTDMFTAHTGMHTSLF
jgi:hypothetical protein